MKIKNLIFKKNYHILSSLETEEVISKLKLITYKFNNSRLENNQFEGKIETNSFKILPIFDFGPREQLRPEINGLIKKIEENNVIELEFRIPNLVLYLFIMLINLGVTTYLYIKPLKNESFLTWKFFLFLIVFSTLIFLNYLNTKIEKSIKILSRTLEGNEKNIC